MEPTKTLSMFAFWNLVSGVGILGSQVVLVARNGFSDLILTRLQFVLVVFVILQAIIALCSVAPIWTRKPWAWWLCCLSWILLMLKHVVRLLNRSATASAFTGASVGNSLYDVAIIGGTLWLTRYMFDLEVLEALDMDHRFRGQYAIVLCIVASLIAAAAYIVGSMVVSRSF